MKASFYTVVFSFLSVIMAQGQQGNYRFNNYGNRSILLAGNVTGGVSDIGLAYYNPSFLADTEEVGFSFNAQAYQLVNIKLENVLNDTGQISSTKFNGASTMAGGVFNLFGTKFAYSYLNKSNYNYNLNYNSYYINDDILSLFPDAQIHQAKIGLNSDIKDDWTGLTWAYKINHKLCIGISGFASIYNYNGRSDLNHTVESTQNEVAFYQSITGFKQSSYGLFLKIGANYKLENFDLGININLPYLEFYGNGKYYYTEVVAGVSSENDKFFDYYFKDLSSKRKEPFGVSVGARIPINKSKLYLNFDYVSGLNSYNRIKIPDIDIGNEELTPVNFDEQRKAVFNFGIGTEYYISEKLKAYGGFSTDFNAFKNSANLSDLSAKENKEINIGEDFYHISLGADWKFNWASFVMGITYTGGNSKFMSPYKINAEGFDVENDLNSQIRFNRWQFVVGIIVAMSGKTVKVL
jgi:hypothetical protein